MGKFLIARYDYREAQPYPSWDVFVKCHQGSYANLRDDEDYPLELQHPQLGLCSLSEARWCEDFFKRSPRITPGSFFEFQRTDPWWPRKRWPTWHAEHSPKDFHNIEWFDGLTPISPEVVKAEMRKGIKDRFGIDIDGHALRLMTVRTWGNQTCGVAKLLLRDRSIRRRILDDYCEPGPTSSLNAFTLAFNRLTGRKRGGKDFLRYSYNEGFFEGYRVKL